jgi:sulfur transfer complex TusBCD TusB component (DsrH family)
MVVMIKSAPDTTDGVLGLTLAKEGGADIVLLQNGVYYVLGDDKRLRGLTDAEIDSRVKTIDYDQLTDLITGDGRVAGMF